MSALTAMTTPGARSTAAPFGALPLKAPPVDQVFAEERAAALGKRSLKKQAKVAGLRLAVRMMDLTTLEGKDSPGKVRSLCAKARRPLDSDPTIGPCGAVCVYPNLVPTAVAALRGSGVHVASVATAFPSGLSPLAIKLDDVRRAVDFGADEIDMVIDRGAMLSGEIAKVFDEIAQTKEACGDAHLKVILETGELGTYDVVRHASEIAMAAGADFIKTSTGKITPAATPAVTLVMLEAIRDFYYATGKRIGMKPAGGIRTAKQALHYLVIVKETLGDAWLTPDLFRFGASTLLNDVLMQLEKERTGAYQGGDYFSKDLPMTMTKEPKASPVAPASGSTAPALDFGSAWTYAPSPEATDHVKIAPRYELFVGGKWTPPKSGKYFDTISPSSEKKLAEVAEASEADVDAAVAAARRAYDKVWSKMKPLERGKYVFRIARRLQEKARELAIVESLDGGKPIKESRDVDIPLAAAHFFYYAGWADKLAYAFPGTNARPLGVAGQVIPWNFPLLMAAWKIAPALACGNTVVLKPAETTPLTALLLAQICEEIDLPPGVVNIITGAGATGAALVKHPGVDKVAFTGSTAVGKLIHRSIAGTKKKLTLELGGKAANIVFADAPIDQAIEGIIGGIFFNQGHVCCAGSRLLVEESVHDIVVRKLKDRMSTLRVGDPLDKNTDVGAINSRMQLEKIRELVASGESEGAARFSAPCPLPEKGFWFSPTIFTGVSQSHRIAREEIFGPVLSILTFRTPDEALEKANNTMYGLSAGIWTDKGAKLFWMANRLRAGVVWGNTYNKFDPTSPFGGYKESGFGREGGRAGLLPYLEVDG